MSRLWCTYTEHLMHEISVLMQGFNFFSHARLQGSIFSPYCDSFWLKLSQYGEKILYRYVYHIVGNLGKREALHAQCMCTIKRLIVYCWCAIFHRRWISRLKVRTSDIASDQSCMCFNPSRHTGNYMLEPVEIYSFWQFSWLPLKNYLQHQFHA